MLFEIPIDGKLGYSLSSLHASLSRAYSYVKKVDKSGYAMEVPSLSPSFDVYNIENMGCARLMTPASIVNHRQFVIG